MIVCQSNCLYKKDGVCKKDSITMKTININNQMAVICLDFKLK